MVLLQQCIIDPGLIIKPVREPGTHQLHQVLIARLIFTQQNQMAVFLGQGALVTHVRAYVYLAPDHRMNALLLARSIKINGAVQHSMVGDGTGGHLHVL